MELDHNPAALPSGSTFHGRYEILRCIRSGGMGAVYEVLDLRTDRHRALKVMLPARFCDTTLLERFKLEATITAQIESEYVVETSDAGVDPETDIPFLVMELLKGEDLDTRLRTLGVLSAEEVVGLLWQASSALDKMHASSILHRDLKPGNLFVTLREDGSAHLKVLDFGIAKVMAQSHHSRQTTGILGTPMYMSPEQLKADGSTGPRSDLYALGHVAYALLVGKPYWEEDFSKRESLLGILLRVAKGCVEPASVRAAREGVTLPSAFDAWFAKATAVEPEDRFDTASNQSAALGEAMGLPTGRPVALRPSQFPPRITADLDEESSSWRRRRGEYRDRATPSGPFEHAPSTISHPPPDEARAKQRKWAALGAAAAAVAIAAALLGTSSPATPVEPKAQATDTKAAPKEPSGVVSPDPIPQKTATATPPAPSAPEVAPPAPLPTAPPPAAPRPFHPATRAPDPPPAPPPPTVPRPTPVPQDRR